MQPNCIKSDGKKPSRIMPGYASFKMQKIFETKRLALRKITPDDIDGLLELFEDPEAMKYLSGTKNRDATKEWIFLVLESYQKNHFGPWAVIRKDTNEFLGYCGLYMQENVDGINEIEILYGLIRRYWAQGYASEAALGVYGYGKKELKLKRFISLIAPGNIRSAKLAGKIGMRLEKVTDMWGEEYQVYSISEIVS